MKKSENENLRKKKSENGKSETKYNLVLILCKNSIFVFVSKFWEFIPNHPIMPVEQNWGECILPIIFIAMLLNIGTVCVQLMKIV